MYYLPKSEEFGTLTLISVYSYYDVPRVFVAHSSRHKSNYLAYWVDETDTYDEWYYVDINSEESSRVENSTIQLRDIFSYKKTFKVITFFNSQEKAITEVIEYNNIDHDALPPFGITVDKYENEKFGLIKKKVSDFRFDENNHEIRLFRERGNKTIEWEPVQKIVGSWSKLYTEVTDSLNLKDPSLVPESSEMGSYKVKFSARHNDELIKQAVHIFSLISNNNLKQLKELKIDLEIIEELISYLKEYKIKFEIRSASGAILSIIDYNKINELNKELTEHNLETIPSSQVPQADELTRLITLTKRISNNESFTEESEGITHRQINYYKTAAELLGLIKPQGLILTPLGWKLALASTDKEAYSILAESFENSDCGWAWLKYTNAESIYDIPPDTAAAFLISKSIGLSESTAKRRATTLKTWITEFNAHR
ncbi:hypothetical protein RUR77_004873 [Klebsiella oxytoca]|nr:hypothetical protein [Klebsiella oxytoca]HDX8883325.1 hypothetical protein [Klebsiella oxytoca]HDX9105053.1 hypothetical protein [Klebsiella oxytoca]